MQIKNLTMSFGTQVLFENVNLNIPENEKVGSTETNYAGAYVGSGKGVVIDFEEDR